MAIPFYGQNKDGDALDKLSNGKVDIILNGGTTRVLLPEESGSYCIFDVVGASNFTLPDPELGMKFTFIQTIINTSDHVIQASTDDHGFIGGVLMMNTTADQTDTFSTDFDGSNDFITLNATTSGGAAAGSTIEVVAILNASAAKCWAVTGNLICSGVAVTPFGDTQL